MDGHVFRSGISASNLRSKSKKIGLPNADFQLWKRRPKAQKHRVFNDFTLESAISVLEMGHFWLRNGPYLFSEWAISILDIIDHPKPRELAFLLHSRVCGPIWLYLASASSAFVFKVSKKLI